MIIERISSKNYYDFLPEAENNCGDIWNNLPTYGVLGAGLVSGVIITPACDLAQHKAETAVFLPIIPVRAYFSLPALLPDAKEKLNGLLKSCGMDAFFEKNGGRYRAATQTEISTLERKINGFLSGKKRPEKDIATATRIKSGISIITKMSESGLFKIPSDDLKLFYGSDWQKIKNAIVTNNHKVDIHFLPKDEQESGFAALGDHSVVLFRYPITIPIEMIESAKSVSELGWSEACHQLSFQFKAAHHFSDARPIKTMRIKSNFLSDLLSRYTAIYARIGSPDFTKPTVSTYVEEIDA